MHLATGGRVPGLADIGYAAGGKLPSSGPGTGVTDGFLGISSAGVPLARVDAGEWIINSNSSDRYNRELAAINAGTFPKLPGYAAGGREYSAQDFARPAAAGGAGVGDLTVYVTNPFTGEQVQGVVAKVARGEIANADNQSQYVRRGRL